MMTEHNNRKREIDRDVTKYCSTFGIGELGCDSVEALLEDHMRLAGSVNELVEEVRTLKLAMADNEAHYGDFAADMAREKGELVEALGALFNDIGIIRSKSVYDAIAELLARAKGDAR